MMYCLNLQGLLDNVCPKRHAEETTLRRLQQWISVEKAQAEEDVHRHHQLGLPNEARDAVRFRDITTSLREVQDLMSDDGTNGDVEWAGKLTFRQKLDLLELLLDHVVSTSPGPDFREFLSKQRTDPQKQPDYDVVDCVDDPDLMEADQIVDTSAIPAFEVSSSEAVLVFDCPDGVQSDEWADLLSPGNERWRMPVSYTHLTLPTN